MSPIDEHPHAIPQRPSWIGAVSLVAAWLAFSVALVTFHDHPKDAGWTWIVYSFGAAIAVGGAIDFLLGQAWHWIRGRR